MYEQGRRLWEEASKGSQWQQGRPREGLWFFSGSVRGFGFCLSAVAMTAALGALVFKGRRQRRGRQQQWQRQTVSGGAGDSVRDGGSEDSGKRRGRQSRGLLVLGYLTMYEEERHL